MGARTGGAARTQSSATAWPPDARVGGYFGAGDRRRRTGEPHAPPSRQGTGHARTDELGTEDGPRERKKRPRFQPSGASETSAAPAPGLSDGAAAGAAFTFAGGITIATEC